MSTDIKTPSAPNHDDESAVRFSKVLRPHRSSSDRDVKIVSAFVFFLFIPTGTAFLVAGAWPVFGFMGLEVAGLIFAIWFNHKIGSAFEAITITDTEFRLSKVDHWGKRSYWTEKPQWLKVRFDEPSKQLIVGVHGRHVVIGKFLMESEREALAEVLQHEVRRATLPPHMAMG